MQELKRAAPEQAGSEPFGIERLARLARGGDREAFVALLERCKPSLLGVARSILRQEEDVADAMQDTVLKAFRGIETLKKPKYCKTWLTRICMNCCYEIVRRGKTVPLADALPEQEIEYEWDAPLDVRAALDSLLDNERLLLTLFYVEDMSQKQIGAVFGISENAVKQRLVRAKKHFKSVYLKGEAVNE